MAVLIAIACIIQVVLMIMLVVLSHKKSKIHFKLLQFDEPEEFAKFDYEELSSRYRGSLYARMKVFFTLIPYYRKKNDFRDEKYREIENELISITKKLLIACCGFILVWCLLIGIVSAMG